MIRYLPFNPDSTVRVSEDVHVSGGKAFLRHIPKKASIVIDGFLETDSVMPQANQFSCLYATDSMYRDANRVLNFNKTHNGQDISVSYVAIGTVITADDMNEIKAHMENQSIHDTNYVLPTMAPNVKGGAKVGANLYMTGDTLNASVGSSFQIGDGFYRSDQESAGMFLRDMADEPVLNSRALFQALKRFPMYSYDIEEGVNQGYFAVETLEDNFVRFVKRGSRHGDLISFYQEPNSGGFTDEGWAFRTNDKWIILSYYKVRYDEVADEERWSSINPFLSVKDRKKLDAISDDNPSSGGGSSDYVLPTMAPNVKGGAKVGLNLFMDGDTLNASVSSDAFFHDVAKFVCFPYVTGNEDSWNVADYEQDFQDYAGRPSKNYDIVNWGNSGSTTGWAIRIDDKWVNLGTDILNAQWQLENGWNKINPILSIKDRQKLDGLAKDYFFQRIDFTPTDTVDITNLEQINSYCQSHNFISNTGSVTDVEIFATINRLARKALGDSTATIKDGTIFQIEYQDRYWAFYFTTRHGLAGTLPSLAYPEDVLYWWVLYADQRPTDGWFLPLLSHAARKKLNSLADIYQIGEGLKLENNVLSVDWSVVQRVPPKPHKVLKYDSGGNEYFIPTQVYENPTCKIYSYNQMNHTHPDDVDNTDPDLDTQHLMTEDDFDSIENWGDEYCLRPVTPGGQYIHSWLLFVWQDDSVPASDEIYAYCSYYYGGQIIFTSFDGGDAHLANLNIPT